jgi:hypothetical protein
MRVPAMLNCDVPYLLSHSESFVGFRQGLIPSSDINHSSRYQADDLYWSIGGYAAF